MCFVISFVVTAMADARNNEFDFKKDRNHASISSNHEEHFLKMGIVSEICNRNDY